MNRLELIDVLADKHNMSKAEAGRVLATFQETVIAVVKRGDSLSLPGLGTFKLSQRAAREGRNPATGAAIKIPAANVPKFTPGSAFKDAVDSQGAARRAAKAGKPAPVKGKAGGATKKR